MQNNNCKNPDTQLPNEVAAVSTFRKLIEAYFDMISLSDVNQLLTEMLSARPALIHVRANTKPLPLPTRFTM